MEFIIKYRDGLQPSNNRYQKWPEELTNKNSRVFKRTFNQIEYEKQQLYWMLSNYIGERKDGEFYFHQQFVENKDIPGITVEDLNNFFLKSGKIQEEYSPKEGDQLIIFRDFYYCEIKNIKRRASFENVSYIYREGKWVNEYYIDALHKTKIVLNGIINI